MQFSSLFSLWVEISFEYFFRKLFPEKSLTVPKKEPEAQKSLFEAKNVIKSEGGTL